MMKSRIAGLVLLVLFGVLGAGCSKAIAPTEPETQDLKLDQEYEKIETDAMRVSSQREQISGLDSSRSGFREGPVMVRSFVKLDPRAFAGSENADEQRANCNAQILQGIATQEECPTNTILRLNRADDEDFPKELSWSKFNDIQNDRENLTIGCVDDGTYTAAPIRNLRDDLTNVVSLEDQETFIAAIDEDEVLNIRITKSAYDIPGRGGSPCDIFFNSLKILNNK